ncbi:YbaB/EbfC family nucleoid-associated protein [Nonomuraea guangzhouensis]|uniref:YbaB/EbfC family nucleoid-associated protein n=1 Tax=Nonomuraea guangzhouensis TaxID=1291555 RepID=A0ABW4G2W3_9ACTN|nr:YbaB/EbfC family nucleoid-associated protein [Nonomuraea guangzhouensis]
MVSSLPVDADGLRAYAQELRDNFVRLQNESRALHDRARAVRVTGRSPDGLVTVTVGARGDLVRLDLDPRVFRRPDSGALAAVITETLHRAAAQAQEEVIAIFEPLIPPAQMRAQLQGDLDAGLWPLSEGRDSP